MYCLLYGCFSLLPVAVIIHYDQNNLRKGFTYLLIFPCHKPSFREAKAGTQSRTVQTGIHAENMQQYYFSDFLLMAFSASLLYNTEPPLQGGTIQSGLDPPMSTVNRDNVPNRLAYRSIWWKHFVSWGSFFLDDSSMCQSWQKTNQHSGN